MNMSGAFGIVTRGIGIWIALLASLGIVASAWLFKKPGDSLQAGFESLKKSMPVSTNQPSKPANTSKVDELEKLINLKNEGKISEEEYEQMKAKL